MVVQADQRLRLARRCESPAGKIQRRRPLQMKEWSCPASQSARSFRFIVPRRHARHFFGARLHIPPALAVFGFVLRTPVPRRTVNPSVSYLRCGLGGPHLLAVVADLEFGRKLIVHLRCDVSGWRPT